MAKIQVNSQGKVYVTSNGILSALSDIDTQPLNVTPSTSAQQINAPVGVNGYNPVNVAAVTSAIDQNIVAGNIKKDVQILGVTGTLESGITPTGTLNVTQNGTYDVTNYASTDVNVSGGIGIPREVSQQGVYQMPSENFTFSLPSDATDVAVNCLSSAFYSCTGLTSVDLSSLTTVSSDNGLYYAFYGCTSLTSVDLSSLTTLSGRDCLSSAFYGCTSLTSIDLSSLTTVSGESGLSDAFKYCSALTSVDFPSLITLNYRGLSYAFQYCTNLTDIYFRALTISSFGSYKNQFGNMMYGTGTSKTHTIHFPANMESTISGLDGYPLFGGTRGYVVLAFDLPATS